MKSRRRSKTFPRIYVYRIELLSSPLPMEPRRMYPPRTHLWSTQNPPVEQSNSTTTMSSYRRRPTIQMVNSQRFRVVQWKTNRAGSTVSDGVPTLQAVQNVVPFKSFTVGIPIGVSYLTSTGVSERWFPMVGGSNALRKSNARHLIDIRWGE